MRGQIYSVFQVYEVGTTAVPRVPTAGIDREAGVVDQRGICCKTVLDTEPLSVGCAGNTLPLGGKSKISSLIDYRLEIG